MDKDYLLKETIALLSADLYQIIYDKEDYTWSDATREIIELAERFEKELNWQDDDDRDYILELEKFEDKIIKKI